MKEEYLRQQLIFNLVKDGIFAKKHLVKLQREKCRKHGGGFFRNIDLLNTYHKLVKNKKIKTLKPLEKLLTMKQVRSLSGIVVISVLTKPYRCPGKCLYCPTEKNVPKSYLSNEPAVMRAIALNYDPYTQVIKRLEALEMEGHPTDKINIRIIGGTWSAYPKQYREWFVSELFRACNSYQVIKLSSYKVYKVNSNAIEQRVLLSEMPVESALRVCRTLSNEANRKQRNRLARAAESEAIPELNMLLENFQKENETAKHRIVEISIETRQDYINKKEIKHLRKLGVTKVELGVQSIYDDVLKLNHRGHSVKETIRATKMLKDAGFKVSYQVMLNLYGSNISRDKKMFKELFSNPDFKPDHLKIYPLALVKNSDLYKLYLKKKFKPYNKNQLIKLLIDIKKEIPYYCRIERIIRDIPAESVVEGGTKFSNMRQILQKDKIFCKCIRCREIKDNPFIKLSSYKVYKVNNQDSKTTKKQNNNIEIYKRGMSPERVTVDSDFRDNGSGGIGWLRVPGEKATPEQVNELFIYAEKYSASGGIEFFLSIENKNRTKLYSMLRLRIPSQILEHKEHFLPVLQNSAIVREIHTYGQQIEISKKSDASQHRGFGKILIAKAEKIVKNSGLKKIAVIAGIGVREYFRKNKYELKDTYMIKNL